MSYGPGTTTLTAGQNFYLKISQFAFTMSQALSLRKLADIMQGTTSLSHQPVWLLGSYYGSDSGNNADAKVLDTESLEAMLADFRSRLWMTYRKDFPSIGPSMLTSDVGWGCTIRSGQMLLAEALARIALGRCWSRQPVTVEEVQPVVRLFVDHPDALLSVHRICTAGVPAGIVPGRWVGPWMLCKSLEALFSPLGCERPMGLHLHVACGSGGGAPELDTTTIRAQMAAASASSAPGCAAGRGLLPGYAQHGSEAVPSERGGDGPNLPSPACTQSGSAAAQRQGNDCWAAPELSSAPGPLGPDDSERRGSGDTQQAATAGAGTSEGGASTSLQQSRPEGLSEGWVATPSQHCGANGPHGSSASPASAANKAAAGSDGLSDAPGGQTAGTADPVSGPLPTATSSSGAAPPVAAAAAENGYHHAGDSSYVAAAAGYRGASGTGMGVQGLRPDRWEDAAVGQPGGQCGQEGAAGPSGRPAAPAPVLLLVPLTLGMDKINPVYVPQLQQILSWPQSVGIVGGRPSASLYLCGVQDSSFLYLDPHEAQPAVRWGIGGEAARTEAPSGVGITLPVGSLATYFCDTVRVLPAAALDPSMAIGFLCMGQADLEDLFSRLDALAKEHSAAPLMTLMSGGPPVGAELDDDFQEPQDAGAQQGGQQQLEEWELV